jgi:low temperature requirement protein LtrA
MTSFRRPRGAEEQRATSLELFYDLVFVFAVTQISHHLLGHLTWEGAGQSALLLMVVWWSWNYTTWVTNELDPELTAPPRRQSGSARRGAGRRGCRAAR